MSASNSAPESNVQENQIPKLASSYYLDEKPLENESSEVEVEETAEGNDEEETECGFCLFMKAGGCKEQFIAWENCVADAEKNKEDIVDKCSEVTGLLQKCMGAHSDYYEPIIRAEKAMEEEVAKELEQVSSTQEAAKYLEQGA